MCHHTHYTKAIECITKHGLFASITLDGLLAIDRQLVADVDNERFWLEVPMVFPVDEAGMVPSAMVRTWLGY
jgi:hypothetical protein